MQVKFSPIRFSSPSYNTVQRPQVTKLQPLKYDTVSFSSRNNDKYLLWNDFQNKFEKAYPNQSLEKVMQAAAKKDENRLGKGAHKIVYDIDKIDDYVLTFYWDRDPKIGAKFKPLADPYSGFNFGQEIAYNGANMAIMKKIKGEGHLFSDWTQTYKNVIYDGALVPYEKAQKFLEDLSDVSELPLEAYVDFAKQVRYLSDKNIKMDLFNPNNIIVDYKDKKISHFDLFEEPENFYCLGPEINGVQDMINILSDALLQGDYAKVLDEGEVQIMNEKTRQIAKKCELAGKIVGLTDDRTTAIRTYKYLQDLLIDLTGTNNKYMEQYQYFHDTYKMDTV